MRDTTTCERQLREAAAVAAAAACLFAANVVEATPEGGVVRAGDASISQSAGRTEINQTSTRAVIDWRRFDIGRGESVQFIQPSASASTLNRVTGDQASVILGQLSATGQVILVNPNGVLFGSDARVDVGSLIATTANLSTTNFMAGALKFDQPGIAGRGIVNQGTISATAGGLVALIAPHVRNDGVIQARLGRVVLASGDTLAIDLYGDKLVSLALSDANSGRLTDVEGKPISALINQAGRIEADGGKIVLMTAGAAKTLVDDVIRMSGIARATAVEGVGGEIVITGRGGRVDVSGRIEAGADRGDAGSVRLESDQLLRFSGDIMSRGGADGRGGQVNLKGQSLAVSGAVDASGPRGAGTLYAWSDTSLTIGVGEARTIAGMLRNGTNSDWRSGASLTIAERIDGLGQARGAGLRFVASTDLNIGNDILTHDGALTLIAESGSVDVARLPDVPLDSKDRQYPLLFTGTGNLTMRAAHALNVPYVLSLGNVDLESTQWYVDVQQNIGRPDFQIAALNIRANGPPTNPKNPTDFGGQVRLRDVALRDGGTLSVEASGYIRVYDQRPNLEGFRLRNPEGLRLSSRTFGELGRRDANPVNYDVYWKLGSSGASRSDVRYKNAGADGDWRTLADNVIDPASPGLPPPGPLAAIPPYERPPESRPPGDIPAPIVRVDAASTTNTVEESESSTHFASGADSDVLPIAEFPGGRGVAQIADLGRTTTTTPAVDVFAGTWAPSGASSIETLRLGRAP